jgi:hypothetical protein
MTMTRCKPASLGVQAEVRASSLLASKFATTTSPIAGQNRDLGLDEPDVKACGDAVSPVGSAGSGCSTSVKAPSESIGAVNPMGSIDEAGSGLKGKPLGTPTLQGGEHVSVEALAKLSRRVARNVNRLFSRLFRKVELTFGLTVTIPPFVKMEVHYKKDFDTPANDNRRARRKSA